MSDRRECAVDGCARSIFARDWCQRHYTAWLRHGDPTVRLRGGTIPKPQGERFWAMVEQWGPDECWPWTGYISAWGYGLFDGGAAHRVGYELDNGPITDEGIEVDHLCFRRSCCNPAHLEAVTKRENILRAALRRSAMRTHCINGHELTPENTATGKSGTLRICRTCRREAMRRYVERGGAELRAKRTAYQRQWVADRKGVLDVHR
jgi:hypothetical protein